MKISITGVPCTGKTEISKKLSERLGWEVISVNEVAEKLNAYKGFDKKMESKILDIEKIKRYFKDIKENVIIEGHVAHEIPSDIVIVLRCDPKVLKKRLKKRYPKNKEKIKENLDAEILGVITSEAVDANKKVFEIDTTKKTIEQNVDDILNILDGRILEYQVGLIDWLEKYEKWLIR
ncbi:MAG: adenylate kinase family protein [Candidatus Aenigmatarchaeota archaeon]